VSVRTLRTSVHYAALLAFAVIMLFPTYWMLVTALTKSGEEFTFPPKLIPDPIVWENFWTALTLHPFGTYYRNSIIVAGLATLGCLLTESLVGYAFARMRFRGRDILFGICLATIMLPFVVTMIPRFILFRHLGMIDTLWPLIIPWWFGGSPFGIFLFRQYYRTLPYELDEAAQVEGAGHLRIWWSVILPQSLPIAAALGILHFVYFWNDFLAPLIYLQSDGNKTLPIGILNYRGGVTTVNQDWNLLEAAALTMIVPVIIVVLLGQRYFKRGLAVTGFGGR
jgi:multiple sugar transport system permease protein